MALLEDLFASADDKGRAFLAGLMAKMAANPADPDGAMAQADVPSGDLLAHVGGGLASKAVNTARSAITAPRDAYTGDLQVFDPATGHVSDEAMGRANEMAGIAMTGGLGGVATRAGEAVLGAGPIRAYHGSPHDFDGFSMAKVGTGEGNQAFGHGLYFAENEGVAKSYRDALSAPQPKTAEYEAVKALKLFDGDRAKAADYLSQQTYSRPGRAPQMAPNTAEAVSMLRGDGPVGGRMYEVGINADPEHFLHWDKPIAEQSEAVQKAIAAGGRVTRAQAVADNPQMTGAQYYKMLGSEPAAASMTLERSGIPGIRYADAGSRVDGASSGTNNMVVFDDKTIEILRKYGLAGLAALGAGQGALGSMSGGLSAGPAEQ